MEVFIFFIALVFVAEVVLPLLRDLVIALVNFAALCIYEVLKLACRAIAWVLTLACRAVALLVTLTFRGTVWIIAQTGHGLAWAAIQTARGAYLGCVFLFYLADEWLRGPGEQEYAAEEKQEDSDDEAEQVRERDAYASALALFGLAPGFTPDDLGRAYKRAIRKAHPDAGGSLDQAQAVNAARDLIARRMGWR
jgi:hypothetical protein